MVDHGIVWHAASCLASRLSLAEVNTERLALGPTPCHFKPCEFTPASLPLPASVRDSAPSRFLSLCLAPCLSVFLLSLFLFVLFSPLLLLIISASTKSAARTEAEVTRTARKPGPGPTRPSELAGLWLLLTLEASWALPLGGPRALPRAGRQEAASPVKRPKERRLQPRAAGRLSDLGWRLIRSSAC